MQPHLKKLVRYLGNQKEFKQKLGASLREGPLRISDGEMESLNLPESESALLKIELPNSVGSLLTGLEVVLENNHQNFAEQYLRNLIKTALNLDVKTAAFSLCEFYTCEQMLPFWIRHEKLRKEVRIFLEDYFNNCESTKKIERRMGRMDTAEDDFQAYKEALPDERTRKLI